ncbi:MAG: NUDIX hydrolase [Patescibacteria group bacterium]
MEIKSKITGRSGEIFDAIFRESDPMLDLEGQVLHSVHALCFYGDNLLVVFSEGKGNWSPPGGSIEVGETPDEAVVREIFEESNMRVIRKELFGYQDVFLPSEVLRQVRFYCEVEPIGDFLFDPDGDITEIKLIEPERYKEYFDWKEIGDHIMKSAMNKNAGSYLKT